MSSSTRNCICQTHSQRPQEVAGHSPLEGRTRKQINVQRLYQIGQESRRSPRNRSCTKVTLINVCVLEPCALLGVPTIMYGGIMLLPYAGAPPGSLPKA